MGLSIQIKTCVCGKLMLALFHFTAFKQDPMHLIFHFYPLGKLSRWGLLAAFSWEHLQNVTVIFKRFYSLILREGEEGGRKRRRETSVCGCFLGTPYQGPGPQPTHVPWVGIKLAMFGSQVSAQSTEPHQLGLIVIFLYHLGTYVAIHIVTKLSWSDNITLYVEVMWI